MQDARLLDLTGQIYDAAAGGLSWQAVGAGLSALLHARTLSLMAGRPGTPGFALLSHHNIPGEAVQAYAVRYRTLDLWTNRAASLIAAGGPARIWTSGEMVPDEEFLHSEFYADFCRRYGLRYVIGTVLPLGEAGVMPIGLHRPAGAAPFDEAERRLLGLVLPHLRRALQLRHRLAPMAEAAMPGLAAIDALSFGMVVLDAGLRVVVANLAAEELVARTGALRFERAAPAGATRLLPLNLAEQAALRRLVLGAALGGGAGGALRLHAEDGSPALAALVSPLPQRLRGGAGGRAHGQALLLLRALASLPPPPPGLLRDLFGLTRAEAETACALLGGQTKAEVAALRGLAESTIRTQVRAVLDKTGTANLRDLAHHLSGLGVLRHRPH